VSDWKDKVVLVTGGTRGIGRACAQAFVDAGATVALCGRSLEKAEAAAKEIGAAKGYQADIADGEAVKAMVKAVASDLGPITILVNNAGVTQDGLLMSMKDDAWNTVIDTNLTGVFHCCRAVARGMVKARYGRIVTISSIVGVHGQRGQTNYGAAKAGLIGFTKSLAKELASRNVTANVVAPGFIQTDMTAFLNEDQEKALTEEIPAGRVGSAEDIASAVRFLASDEAGYITGAVVPVDGGLGM
jgi:3-oxoacyl-[acyl-carrier protein] reductase